MNTHPNQLADLAERLERLERQNRRMKQVAAGLLILITVGALAAAAPPEKKTEKVVEADKFVVKDEKGVTRIEVGMQEGHPAIILSNDKGQARLIALVQKKDARVVVVGTDEKRSVTLSADESGAYVASQDIGTDTPTVRAILGTAKKNALVAVGDEKGQLRSRLIQADEGSSLEFLDKDDNLRMLLHESPAVGGALRVFDAKKNERILLGHKADEGYLRFGNEDEKVLVDLTVNSKGSVLGLHDEKGRVRLGLVAKKSGGTVDLYDEEGTGVGSLATTDLGFAGLIFLNPKKGAVSVGLQKGDPAIVITDKDGKQLFSKP